MKSRIENIKEKLFTQLSNHNGPLSENKTYNLNIDDKGILQIKKSSYSKITQQEIDAIVQSLKKIETIKQCKDSYIIAHTPGSLDNILSITFSKQASDLITLAFSKEVSPSIPNSSSTPISTSRTSFTENKSPIINIKNDKSYVPPVKPSDTSSQKDFSPSLPLPSSININNEDYELVSKGPTQVLIIKRSIKPGEKIDLTAYPYSVLIEGGIGAGAIVETHKFSNLEIEDDIGEGCTITANIVTAKNVGNKSRIKAYVGIKIETAGQAVYLEARDRIEAKDVGSDGILISSEGRVNLANVGARTVIKAFQVTAKDIDEFVKIDAEKSDVQVGNVSSHSEIIAARSIKFISIKDNVKLISKQGELLQQTDTFGRVFKAYNPNQTLEAPTIFHQQSAKNIAVKVENSTLKTLSIDIPLASTKSTFFIQEKKPINHIVNNVEEDKDKVSYTVTPSSPNLSTNQNLAQSNTEVNQEAPLNIVFLDIDGVLLSGGDADDNIEAYKKKLNFMLDKLGDEYKQLRPVDIGAALRFSKEAVNNLKTLCYKANAKIVISSDWRIIDNNKENCLKKLQLLFKLWDLHNLIMDVTPNLGFNHNKEIKNWLDTTTNKINSFVILDDVDSGLSKTFPKHFVKTNHLFIEEDLKKALSFFKSQQVTIHNSNTRENQLETNIVALGSLGKFDFLRLLCDEHASLTEAGRRDGVKAFNSTGYGHEINDDDISLALYLSNNGYVDHVGYLTLNIKFIEDNCVDMTDYLKYHSRGYGEIKEIRDLVKPFQAKAPSVSAQSKLQFFKPVPGDKNNPIIDKLNITVSEFNEQYKNQFFIHKDNSYGGEGFWTIRDDDGKECCVLNGETTLKDTGFGSSKYDFIKSIQKTSFDLN